MKVMSQLLCSKRFAQLENDRYWILDLGASSHMTGEYLDFVSYTKL